LGNAMTADQLIAWATKTSSEIVKREGAALARAQAIRGFIRRISGRMISRVRFERLFGSQ